MTRFAFSPKGWVLRPVDGFVVSVFCADRLPKAALIFFTFLVGESHEEQSFQDYSTRSIA
jgi:hypothetical protein